MFKDNNKDQNDVIDVVLVYLLSTFVLYMSLYMLLIRFKPMLPFHTPSPGKHQKTSSFLIFSEGIDREHWPEIIKQNRQYCTANKQKNTKKLLKNNKLRRDATQRSMKFHIGDMSSSKLENSSLEWFQKNQFPSAMQYVLVNKKLLLKGLYDSRRYYSWHLSSITSTLFFVYLFN